MQPTYAVSGCHLTTLVVDTFMPSPKHEIDIHHQYEQFNQLHKELKATLQRNAHEIRARGNSCWHLNGSATWAWTKCCEKIRTVHHSKKSKTSFRVYGWHPNICSLYSISWDAHERKLWYLTSNDQRRKARLSTVDLWPVVWKSSHRVRSMTPLSKWNLCSSFTLRKFEL